MWSTIMDLIQRKTLLNKLTTRRRFYSAKMAGYEKVMAFISRVRQLASDCKAMGVVIDSQEIAMTVLCDLPPNYEHQIVAIHPAANDKSLTLEFVNSRLFAAARGAAHDRPRRCVAHGRVWSCAPDAPRSQRHECGHCGKPEHTEPRC